MKRTKKETSAEQEAIRRLAGTIHMLRVTERMSLREFAKKAGVEYAYIFRLENGVTANPSVMLLHRVASAFGLTIDELLNFNARECPTCKGAGWVKNE